MEDSLSSLPGVKSLLQRSWQIYKERFSTFIAISAVSLVMAPAVIMAELKSLFALPLGLLAVFFTLWQGVALIYAIKDRDQKIGFKESFSKGLPKIWPYLWTGILFMLIVLGGSLLLIIPGIIFGVWFMFYRYAIVVENLSGKKSLSRSKQLVKGNFWAIVWRNFVIILAVLLVTGFISGFWGKNVSDLISPIISIFLTPFAATYFFLIYEDMKKQKEGII